jgi:predicted  nucleic acid-binding Zn-ribbon protein
MFDEEKLLIGDLKKCDEVRLELGEIKGIEGKLGELKDKVRLGEVEIVGLKEEIERLKREVEEIKGSSEYVSYLKLKEEVVVLSGRVEREVLKLKGLIDFKKLIGIVHGNSRELEVAKGFRDSFVSEFFSNGEKLVGILEGCGMKSKEVYAQILKISKLREELSEAKKSVGEDLSVEKLEEIRKAEGEIEVMKISSVKVRGRVKEFEVKLDNLKGEIVGLVGGLGKCL